MRFSKPVPAPAADLAAAERKLGVIFPPQFAATLRSGNGGTLDDSTGSTMERWRMLPVLDTSSRRRIAETRADIVWHTEQARADSDFPAHGVVIARASTPWNRLILLGDPDQPSHLADDVYRQVGWGQPILVAASVADLGVPLAAAMPHSADEPLPVFRFHPDPVASRSISPSRARCARCHQRRGYIYRIPWAAGVSRPICPWCLADGSAATAFSALFVPDAALHHAGLAEDWIHEVCCQTPGVATFQPVEWQVCCGMPATFCGALTSPELAKISNEELWELGIPASEWPQWRTLDPTVTGITVYRFECGLCAQRLLWVDHPTA